jgi:hypothetical protein
LWYLGITLALTNDLIEKGIDYIANRLDELNDVVSILLHQVLHSLNCGHANRALYALRLCECAATEQKNEQAQ